MQRQFLTSTFRKLYKNRQLGLVNTVGLAIGMASAFLILLWVQNEFSFDNYHPDGNREYLLTWTGKEKTINTDGSPFPLTQAAIKDISAIDGITCFYPHGADPLPIRAGTSTGFEKNFIYADSNWFRLLHFYFLAGNASGFGEGNGVIMTRSLADRYFGRKPAVGQVIALDGTSDFSTSTTA